MLLALDLVSVPQAQNQTDDQTSRQAQHEEYPGLGKCNKRHEKHANCKHKSHFVPSNGELVHTDPRMRHKASCYKE